MRSNHSDVLLNYKVLSADQRRQVSATSVHLLLCAPGHPRTRSRGHPPARHRGTGGALLRRILSGFCGRRRLRRAVGGRRCVLTALRRLKYRASDLLIRLHNWRMLQDQAQQPCSTQQSGRSHVAGTAVGAPTCRNQGRLWLAEAEQ